MVSVKDTGDESIFDRFTPLFANIVDLVERIQAKRMPTFSADISTVAILYYAGAKCRHPIIRRKAVALLGDSPRREGIWDSKGAASVLKQALALEERMANCSINDETDLSKSARLRGFCIDLDGESDQWGIQYKYLTSSDELVSSLENMMLESSGDDESS